MQYFKSQRLLVTSTIDLSLYQDIIKVIINELTLYHCVGRFRAVMY